MQACQIGQTEMRGGGGGGSDKKSHEREKQHLRPRFSGAEDVLKLFRNYGPQCIPTYLKVIYMEIILILIFISDKCWAVNQFRGPWVISHSPWSIHKKQESTKLYLQF
jgi:hypothetical protein